MTKAEIITAVRNLVNEVSTDSGAFLDDAANLLEFINDAMEEVVMDLMDFMPYQFLTSETVTLVANQANYTLSNTFWKIHKVAKNVSSEVATEIRIIDQLDVPYYMYVGETADEPDACYFVGDTLYFVPTPSAAKTAYAKVWEIVPEAATMATGGPTYIPRPAHRCIVYKAAALVAVALEANPNPYMALYENRLRKVRRVWQDRIQQEPRFIRESVLERGTWNDREAAFYDLDWPE